MDKTELEHGIDLYSKDFGIFVSDFFDGDNDMLSMSVRKRSDVESGYWITITWIDRECNTHQVEAQWRRLAWRRLFEAIIKDQDHNRERRSQEPTK